MESRFIEEDLKVIVSVFTSAFNYDHVSSFFVLMLFLESKVVANTNISCSSWFYVFICPIKIT